MKKFILLLLPVAALICEILPVGAVLTFAPFAGENADKAFSYFDIALIGYSHIAPFLTALLTCAVLAAAVFSLKYERMKRTVFAFSLIGFAVSVPASVLNGGKLTFAGIAVTVFLLLQSIISFFAVRKSDQ